LRKKKLTKSGNPKHLALGFPFFKKLESELQTFKIAFTLHIPQDIWNAKKLTQRINMKNKSSALQRSYQVQGIIEPGLFVHICTVAEENVFFVYGQS
jgi:hypothetical protein